MQTEPSFPYPLPDAATVDALLARLQLPDAYRDESLDAAIKEAFGMDPGKPGRYAASTDDALSLVEAVLPGWSIDMQCGRLPDRRSLDELGGEGPYLYVTVKEWLGGPTFVSRTPPCAGRTRGLSICIALFSTLKAYLAKQAG